MKSAACRARWTTAIYTRTVGGSNATVYLHRDHLGSPELITDSSGNVLLRPSFSAYGERRDGTDWDGAIGSGDLNLLAGISRRGFTGHEHLDSVGLIHMNGRVYESIAGRFLSRDPFIDGVASSQGMNGYAYVHNNPLTLVDPSGFHHCDEPGVSCAPQRLGRRPLREPALEAIARIVRDPYDVGPAGIRDAAATWDGWQGGTGVEHGVPVSTAGGADSLTTLAANSLGDLILAQARPPRRGPGGGRTGQRPVGPNASSVEQYIPGGSLRANEQFPNAHVLREHVGRSVSQLQARLAANSRLGLASSFRTQAEAEAFIGEALARAPIQRINVGSGQWYQFGFRIELGRPTGVSVIPGAPSAAIPTGVWIVLRHHPRSDTGYYIYTAYPD